MCPPPTGRHQSGLQGQMHGLKNGVLNNNNNASSFISIPVMTDLGLDIFN